MVGPLDSVPRPGSKATRRVVGRTRVPLAILLVLLLSPGCRHYRPTESGFLSDYSHLEKDPFHINRGIGWQRTKTRYATTQEMAAIDSFYIEPSQWRIDEKSRAGGNAWRKQMLTDKYHESLRDELSQVRPIVDQPGPRTATVRSAITNVRLSRPLVNVALTATLFTPFGVGPIFFGGGVTEAEVISHDGRQIAAVSSGSTGGFIDVVGYYSRSGHARKAMKRNSRELYQALERNDKHPADQAPPAIAPTALPALPPG